MFNKILILNSVVWVTERENDFTNRRKILALMIRKDSFLH